MAIFEEVNIASMDDSIIICAEHPCDCCEKLTTYYNTETSKYVCSEECNEYIAEDLHGELNRSPEAEILAVINRELNKTEKITLEDSMIAQNLIQNAKSWWNTNLLMLDGEEKIILGTILSKAIKDNIDQEELAETAYCLWEDSNQKEDRMVVLTGYALSILQIRNEEEK